MCSCMAKTEMNREVKRETKLTIRATLTSNPLPTSPSIRLASTSADGRPVVVSTYPFCCCVNNCGWMGGWQEGGHPLHGAWLLRLCFNRSGSVCLSEVNIPSERSFPNSILPFRDRNENERLDGIARKKMASFISNELTDL